MSGAIQCYLSPNYGYKLQGSAEQITNGLRLKLQRNSAVGSMFKQPIDNVLLDVQYYTNDIIRFKLYDADNKRYEVRRQMKLRVLQKSFFIDLGTDTIKIIF